MKKLLFVCTGNICRSPTAHAIARHKIKKQKLEDQLFADSAGISAFHVGERPDKRSVAVGLKKGVNFNNIKARKFIKADFEEFDLIFAMDIGHLEHLQNICPEEHLDKVHLLTRYANIDGAKEVTDPYYGGIDGFSSIFDMIEESVVKVIDLCKN